MPRKSTAHVAGVAGHGQPLLGVCVTRARDARHAAGQPVRERAQGAIEERLLELELLEVLACIDPSWVRRAWTGSTGELPASPMTIRRMAPAATSATTMARGSIG